MRPVSDLFAETVVRSHTVAFKVEVLRGGVVIAGTDAAPLDVLSGRVTLDRRAKVRGRCDLVLGGDHAPQVAIDAVTPFGSELRVYRGIQYEPTTVVPPVYVASDYGKGDYGEGLYGVGELVEGDPILVPGDTELVSLGVFRVEDVEVTDGPQGVTVRVSGRDRSAAVSDARFVEPYIIEAGSEYVRSVMRMVDAGVLGLTWAAVTSTSICPPIVFPEGEDRWDAALEMAAAIGYELFFDGDGVAVMRPEPEADTEPVIEVAEGDRGVLVTAAKRWTRQGGYNAVVASGENTGNEAPARGAAFDLDPFSPRYWLGPYGQVPRYWSSPFIADDDQAARAALGMLRRQFGVAEQVTFTAFPNPALEPGDAVLVKRERLGVDQVHVIDSLDIPLDVTSPLSAITRSRQVSEVT